MDVIERICTSCKKMKSLNDFHSSKLGKYGKCSRCKECKKLENYDWIANNQDQARKIDRNRYKRNRDLRLEESKEYYHKNKQQIKLKKKEYRENNKEKLQNKAKEFYKNNKEKIRAARKKWSQKNKLNNKNKRYLKEYGITYEFYIKKCEELNNKCQICQKFSEKLVVDHCHDKKLYRGLLCTLCNTGIGQLRDSLQNLYSAIKYLEDFNGRS